MDSCGEMIDGTGGVDEVTGSELATGPCVADRAAVRLT